MVIVWCWLKKIFSKSWIDEKYIQSYHMPRKNMHAGALEVIEKLQEKGYAAYVVGGCVRDALMGHVSHDFDVATNARPHQVKALFKRSYYVGKRFRIVHVRAAHKTIEVITFRGKSLLRTRANAQGILVRDNAFGNLHTDARRRDFTMNAMYYDPVKKQIIDFYGGVDDCKKGILQLIGDPDQRIKEDPVRILRAVRLGARYGLCIEPELFKAMKSYATRVQFVSDGRLYLEILKLAYCAQGEKAFTMLHEIGVFSCLFPDFSEKDLPPLLIHALAQSDVRLQKGLGVSGVFFWSVLLWSMSGGIPLDEKYDVYMKFFHKRLRTHRHYIIMPKRVEQNVTDLLGLVWMLVHPISSKKHAYVRDHRLFRMAVDFLAMLSKFDDALVSHYHTWKTEYDNMNIRS